MDEKEALRLSKMYRNKFLSKHFEELTSMKNVLKSTAKLAKMSVELMEDCFDLGFFLGINHE